MRCHIHAWIKDGAQIADRYIANLNNLTIYGDRDTEILARCLGVPSARTSVVSAFSFSLFCHIHVYVSETALQLVCQLHVE